MELNIAAPKGSKSGTVTVSDASFGREYNQDLIHQAVVAYLANARQGTKKQKTRSEVSVGGRKPWRQKGTGRARAGTIRSPIWRGGGNAFAARSDQNHSKQLNKKMYRAALQSILSELARQDRLVVVESFDLDEPKTKGLISRLNDFGVDDVLIITEEVSQNLYLSARNLHRVDVRDASGVDPVCLINYDKVMVTVSALKKIEEMLG